MILFGRKFTTECFFAHQYMDLQYGIIERGGGMCLKFVYLCAPIF